MKQAYERKYHYVYKTINTKNGMYYIGLHSHDKLDNNYLGSGRHFKFALASYGKESFTKTILKVFLTREEASEHEAELITLEVISDPTSYNLSGGGDNGGVGVIRSEESKEKNRQSHLGNRHGELTKELCRSIMVEEHKIRAAKGDNVTYEKIKAARNTEESKEKTRQQAISQWSDPVFRAATTEKMKQATSSQLFKNKSSYNSHRHHHLMGNKISEKCRWCGGEQPTWDISHLANIAKIEGEK